MHEIAKVTLDNEMDLILAHKRSMKLAELAGLSLSAQTTFATAVSEVSRNAIESLKSSSLILNIDTEQRDKYLVASLQSENGRSAALEGLEFAKKLVSKYDVSSSGNHTSVQLYYYISPSFRIDLQKLDEWRSMFRNEPPISPYEELKRKNEQLQELSEKVQKSEAQYKILTNSLPLIIFTLDVNGQLLFANQWLSTLTGQSIHQLNKNKWNTVVHPDDFDSFHLLLEGKLTKGVAALRTQARIKSYRDDVFLWHQVSLTPFKNDAGEVQYWIGFLVDINAQKVYEETLRDNQELKETQAQLQEYQRVQNRYIEELNRSNRELQQFAFVASHDLQEPVRKLLFYSDYLLGNYDKLPDSRGTEVLQTMQQSAQRMRGLIQDLLLFSQISKEKITAKEVDLNQVAKDASSDLDILIRDKNAVVTVSELPWVRGDETMLRQLFVNIIGNSLKYARPSIPPVISISSGDNNGEVQIVFTDNGIGFDSQYAEQIFTLFQRLHSRENYAGTGLGLAICRKVVELHGGKMHAQGIEGKGASFFVTLPSSL